MAGGTGAAKLAVGLQTVLAPGDLTVVTNSADDDTFWGLLVCPDTDSVLYRLAGIFNHATGFGVDAETFATLAMLKRLGEPTWFGLGDRDIGLHLLRNRLLGSGMRLTECIAEIARRLAIPSAVLPMCDEPVRTRIITNDGELRFQEWFVRDRCEPTVSGVRFEGIEAAHATPEVLVAVRDADLIVIGPSNPLVSVAPILQIAAAALQGKRVIAVAPIIAGQAMKGPTVRMLQDLGRGTDAVAAAHEWQDVATDFVVDSRDAALAPSIEALGLRVHHCDVEMTGDGGAQRLAGEVLAMAKA